MKKGIKIDYIAPEIGISAMSCESVLCQSLSDGFSIGGIHEEDASGEMEWN